MPVLQAEHQHVEPAKAAAVAEDDQHAGPEPGAVMQQQCDAHDATRHEPRALHEEDAQRDEQRAGHQALHIVLQAMPARDGKGVGSHERPTISRRCRPALDARWHGLRHNGATMPGFALFIGDHLARSVRGVPGAPPA
jgi:hypothetical protein